MRALFYALSFTLTLTVYLALALSSTRADLRACRAGANDVALDGYEEYLREHPRVASVQGEE